jgi:hypothetical protein
MNGSNCFLGGLLILLALSGASCSTPANQTGPAASHSGQYYVVSAKEAEFYRYGPQQANGPNEKLAEGTLVVVVRPAFGYSKVQLSNGLQGYVAGESGRQSRSRHNIVDPRFLPPPPPLPEDQPEPTPIPGSEPSATP